MQEKAILRQIAERYKIDVKTVTRRIKEHPELGIEIVKRQAPVLDEKQIQALCAILDERYPAKPKQNETLRRIDLESRQDKTAEENDVILPIPSPNEIKDLQEEISRLKDEMAALKTDLAVERARIEGKDALIARLESENERYPKLLQAGDEQIEALREEVASAREEAAAARDEWKSKSFIDRWLKR